MVVSCCVGVWNPNCPLEGQQVLLLTAGLCLWPKLRAFFILCRVERGTCTCMPLPLKERRGYRSLELQWQTYEPTWLGTGNHALVFWKNSICSSLLSQFSTPRHSLISYFQSHHCLLIWTFLPYRLFREHSYQAGFGSVSSEWRFRLCRNSYFNSTTWAGTYYVWFSQSL